MGGGGLNEKLKGDFSIFQIPEGGYFETSFNVPRGGGVSLKRG